MSNPQTRPGNDTEPAVEPAVEPYTVLAAACAAIDALDDIEQMASLGALADELATLLDDRDTLAAATTVIEQMAHPQRVLDVFGEHVPHDWMARWLRRNAHVTADVSERVALAGRRAFAAALAEPQRIARLALLDDGITDLTADLAAALDRHRASATAGTNQPASLCPDTIPADWGIDSESAA